MLAIFKREVTAFFSSLIGYVAIGLFLTITGLFLWVTHAIPSGLNLNILDSGYSTLDNLFYIAPYVFIFLIPAVTMKMFSEEKKLGTFEILVTRPITELQIILGKYIAALALVLISLLPTLIYYYTIYNLSTPIGNVDIGAIRGSYAGLCLLSAVFIAIGLFASALTDSQIVSFILAMFICFIFLDGFYFLSQLSLFGGKADDIIQSIGIRYHYSSISRGIIDSRDVIYFLSLIVIFMLCTKTALESRKW